MLAAAEREYGVERRCELDVGRCKFGRTHGGRGDGGVGEGEGEGDGECDGGCETESIGS